MAHLSDDETVAKMGHPARWPTHAMKLHEWGTRHPAIADPPFGDDN
jgi:hypothetical protein